MGKKSKPMGTIGDAIEIEMRDPRDSQAKPEPQAPVVPVVPVAPVGAPPAPETPEAAPKARHTLKGDVSMAGNFLAKGVRVVQRKFLDKKPQVVKRSSSRQGKLRSFAAALLLAVVAGAAVIWVAHSVAAQTLEGARSIVAEQSGRIAPYTGSADTSARTMKMLAYPSTPMWLLWARRMPMIETGLVTRMSKPGAEKPFAHWKGDAWYKGAGPDLSLPRL